MAGPPTCWALSDGKAGTENQCVGLAEAMGLVPVVKRVRPRAPWSLLPVGLGMLPKSAMSADGREFAPPWPGLLIASGRRSVPYSLAIRRLNRGATFTVQIQNPRIAPHRFDLLAVPRHDHVHGANVVQTLGALNRVTSERLREAAAAFASMFAHLPRPLVAVLVGGTSGSYRLTPEATGALCDKLADLCRAAGAGLAVTPSRRTGDANVAILGHRLAELPATVWAGAGENPYFGLLGLADALIVTSDSVSMASDACATGKPVYIVDLPGGSRKFREFHASLRSEGVTRLFKGELETWSYAPPNDTAHVADEVARRMGLTGGWSIPLRP